MAACSFNRVDSRNTSTGKVKYASRLLVDSSTGDIMLAWIDSGVGGATPQPQSVRFARFNPTTLTPSAEVAIKTDYTFDSTVRGCDMVQLDDGTLLVIWYWGGSGSPTGNATYWSKSTDGGATWSAPDDVSTDQNRFAISLMTDGTTAWIITVTISGLTATGDLNSYKFSAGAWGAAVKVYEGNGQTGTPGAFDWVTMQQISLSGDMTSATNGWLVYWRSVDATSNDYKLTRIRTTDGWASDATANVLDIQTFSAEGSGYNINSAITTTGRIYIQTNDPDNAEKMRVYYSDDDGVTWTTIGTPTIYATWLTTNGVSGDASYDSFCCLDALDNIVIGQSSGTVLSPSGKHATFRSGPDPTDLSAWALVGECTYSTATDPIINATAGRGVIIGTTLYRLVAMARPAAVPYYTLEFLSVEDAGRSIEPHSPAVIEESAADDNNLYLRNNVAEGGGWSLHTHPVAYFLDWDEGDAETGREIPLLLAANPSMDPAIQDPAYIPAFTRINDPGSYTRRTYVTANGTLQVIPDPLPMRIVTPFYLIAKEFESNAGRAVNVEWILDGDSTPTVEVWIDDNLNLTIELYNTYGKLESKLFSLSAFANVGEKVQFVIEDLSPFFFAIETLSLTYIEKGMRG